MGTVAQLDAFLASVEKRAYAMTVMAVRNRDDALDIVQDVMLTLARKYAQKPVDEWTPLFYRILRNRITDFHRAQTVRGKVWGWLQKNSDDAEEEDPLQQVADPAPQTPHQQFELAGVRQELVSAVEQLPARQQQAFMLRIWEGLDVRDTAKAMACSQGSVKTHLSRALTALREQLQEFHHE